MSGLVFEGVVQIGERIISGWRPSGMSREEEELRWKLALGYISFDEFERRYKKLLKAGKIKRSGRIVEDVD